MREQHEDGIGQETSATSARPRKEIAVVLRERGIDVVHAGALQLHYCEPEQTANLLDDREAAVPSIAIPYLGLRGGYDGYKRLKLLSRYVGKDGKERRYSQPKGTKNRLYFPPLIGWAAVAQDASVPLLITEGEFKAIKASQEGYPCVALGGVWSWRARSQDAEEGERSSAPIPDLNLLNWKGRRVTIVFDSDAATNPEVQRAQRALAKELFHRGAAPRVAKLPHLPGATKTGLDDWWVKRGKRAKKEFDALLAAAESSYELEPQSAATLAEAKFKEPVYVVDGFLPAGLATLNGPPKTAKSFLAVQLAHAVATGTPFMGVYPAKQGRALVCALEDTPPRIQRRLKMMKLAPTDALGFVYANQLRKGDEGVAQLVRWCEQNPDAKLIVIDTLQKFRSPGDSRANAYEQDVATCSAIKAVADRFGIAILMIHHLRKGEASDVFDRVSGSTGITGTADTNMVLLRDRYSQDAALNITGRDVIEQERALVFAEGLWTDVGEAGDVRATQAERQVLDALAGGHAMKRKEIAATIGRKSDGALDRTLGRLVEKHLIEVVTFGTYKLAEKSPQQQKY